ncbi:hypothetical protein ACOMHN_066413 [Nucella lapillus]
MEGVYSQHDDGGSVQSEHDDGVSVQSEHDDGGSVQSEHDDGVSVQSEHDDGVSVQSEYHDGVGVQSEHHDGVSVQSEHDDGVSVQSEHDDGVSVQSEHDDGVSVQSEHDDGVSVQSEHHDGVSVQSEHHDGVSVQSEHDDGVSVQSEHHDGVSVQSEHDDGVSVQSEHDDGVSVQSEHHDGVSVQSEHDDGVSGQSEHDDGVSVQSEHDDGVSVQLEHHDGGSVQSEHDDGVSVQSEPDDGGSVQSEHDDGVSVQSEHDDGVSVQSEHHDGVSVQSEHDDGVSGHCWQEETIEGEEERLEGKAQKRREKGWKPDNEKAGASKKRKLLEEKAGESGGVRECETEDGEDNNYICITAFHPPKEQAFAPTNQEWRAVQCKRLNFPILMIGSLRHRPHQSSLGIPNSVDTIFWDGNCLYRALSLEITGTQAHHEQVREIIVDFIIKNPQPFSAYLGCNLQEYLVEGGFPLQPKTWGTDVEVLAAATLLQTPVVVYSACLFMLVAVKADGHELVTNGGFETLSTRDWRCRGCSLQLVSSDTHSGRSALKVTSRRGIYSGPGQKLTMRRATRYRVQAYAKQLNDHTPSSFYQKHSLRVTFQYADQKGAASETIKVAARSAIRSVDGWFSLIAFFIVPDRAVTAAQLRHDGPAPGISFLLDDVSVTEIAEDMDWKTQADHRIDQLRKGDINIRVNLPNSINPADVSVQIDHKKHLFNFGTMVKDSYILDPQYKGYQDIVYSAFNSATLQSFKWKFDKGTRNHPDYSQAVSTMRLLKEEGLEVRAHSMFWGLTKNMPSWVPNLDLHTLNRTVQERLHFMVSLTKGQLQQWDIMNELLHGQWFEEKFQDPHYSQQLYKQVKQLSPNTTVFLNDYHVVSMCDGTDAYLQQAKQFLANGVPLGALGIQSHFDIEAERPDPTLMKIRLDYLAQSHLPLWVTELNLMARDPQERADLYERVFRVYFSHPAVYGIVIWGFWDQHAKGPEAALVDGYQYTINEAGRRVFNLIQNEWSTHVKQTLGPGRTNVNLRGFKGDYDVIVRVRGAPRKVTSFSLSGSSVTVNLHLTGQEAIVTVPPPLPTLVPLSPSAPHYSTTTKRSTKDDHSMGKPITSSSSSPFLHCLARWSPFSTTLRDDQEARVGCHQGEVLTGCSSVLENDGGQREGEIIEIHLDQPVCTAVDSNRNTEGVRAVAMCCTAQDLTCSYRTAGPSPSPSTPGHQLGVRTTCPSPQQPLGCSSWNEHSGARGASPSFNTCRAQSHDPAAGVYVSAACCSAPRMTCVTVTSSPSGLSQGDVARVGCDAGYAMTSCQAVSGHGKSSGAYKIGSVHSICRASNGAQLDQGQLGVKAVATCCKMTGQ